MAHGNFPSMTIQGIFKKSWILGSVCFLMCSHQIPKLLAVWLQNTEEQCDIFLPTVPSECRQNTSPASKCNWTSWSCGSRCWLLVRNISRKLNIPYRPVVLLPHMIEGLQEAPWLKYLGILHNGALQFRGTLCDTMLLCTTVVILLLRNNKNP